MQIGSKTHSKQRIVLAIVVDPEIPELVRLFPRDAANDLTQMAGLAYHNFVAAVPNAKPGSTFANFWGLNGSHRWVRSIR